MLQQRFNTKFSRLFVRSSKNVSLAYRLCCMGLRLCFAHHPPPPSSKTSDVRFFFLFLRSIVYFFLVRNSNARRQKHQQAKQRNFSQLSKVRVRGVVSLVARLFPWGFCIFYLNKSCKFIGEITPARWNLKPPPSRPKISQNWEQQRQTGHGKVLQEQTAAGQRHEAHSRCRRNVPGGAGTVYGFGRGNRLWGRLVTMIV